MTLAGAVTAIPVSTQASPLLAGGGFIELAILFLILAVVAAVLGATEVAGLSLTIAKWFVIGFVILAVISLVL
jgi:uncharacterized membrane protein YtjA (UPF0391 family)